MSAQHIQVLSPIPVTAPKGAVWAAQAAVWLARMLRGAAVTLWQALEAQGERRAARELRSIAQRWESLDPALARKLRLAGAYMDESQRNRSAQHTHKEIK
jgi:hypothetical protein